MIFTRSHYFFRRVRSGETLQRHCTVGRFNCESPRRLSDPVVACTRVAWYEYRKQCRPVRWTLDASIDAPIDE